MKREICASETGRSASTAARTTRCFLILKTSKAGILTAIIMLTRQTPALGAAPGAALRGENARHAMTVRTLTALTATKRQERGGG